MEDSEGWRAEGKESLNRVPDAWSLQTSQPQTQRFPCPATSGILEIIGMCLMPRRKNKEKKKHLKPNTKIKFNSEFYYPERIEMREWEYIRQYLEETVCKRVTFLKQYKLSDRNDLPQARSSALRISNNHPSTPNT